MRGPSRYRFRVQLVGLWRYPVKSMGGEELTSALLEPVGLVGDRQFGVLDVRSGHVLSAKREGRLLLARASIEGVRGQLRVELPTGVVLNGPGPTADAALTAWLGYPARLVAADPEERATFESQTDFENDASATRTWEGLAGSLVDSAPLLVLTTGTLRAVRTERPDLTWEVARFRPNLLIDSEAEDLPAVFTCGTARIETVKPCQRCVMVTRSQPGPPVVLDKELEILRHLLSQRGGNLGVLARVPQPGIVALGQPVHGESIERSATPYTS